MYYTPKEIMRCFLSYYFKLARKSNYSLEKYKEFVCQNSLPSLKGVVGRLKKQSDLKTQEISLCICLLKIHELRFRLKYSTLCHETLIKFCKIKRKIFSKMTDAIYSSIRETIDSYDFDFDGLCKEMDIPFHHSLRRQRESIQEQIDILKLLRKECNNLNLYLS
ncbi:unnamed protein product [Moneuplotes crassus]|uniref:Uncharacterized protein n=1 Tax=Euplotes crassus TaxID=5936 RepID=A0AAD2D0N8_EUPCR|nr:unnamed protein product [Moneuplotes crassus]